jgi:phosphoribosylformylglycinamidine cyclo-ligase
MTNQPLTYAGSGVSYDQMDPFKRLAMQAASSTDSNITRFGWIVDRTSRGESSFAIKSVDGRPIALTRLAGIPEGLGTKNLVADAVRSLSGRTHYDQIAQDAVAMMVNDIATLGDLPLYTGMHCAAGRSDWFTDEERARDLVWGWAKACDLARCVYGPGESPTLVDIIHPDRVVLDGFVIGQALDGHIGVSGPRPGDAIVMLASSGIHANGITLARRIAERTGYDALLSDGRPFGETILDPTTIYVPVVEDCLRAGISLHYMVNITGHGWRKLMRSNEPLVYVIDTIPTPQPVFDFIAQNGPVDLREMYGNYNMGAGFALYIAPEDTERVISIAGGLGVEAWSAGRIERQKDEKKVLIQPLDLTFEGDTLRVR